MSARNPWRETALGALLSVKHGFAFRGEYFSDSGSHIVLTPGNFNEEGGFVDRREKAKWYRGPIPEEYVLPAGSLLLAMTEQAEGLLGSSALVPHSSLYLHNQRLGLVQVREPQSADTKFLYYLFNHRPVRQQIRASASGTKIRHTSPTRIEAVVVPVPGVDQQRRIASILSAYDDLIENCQRRIRILEDMARGLYREWFVHFRFPGADSLPRVEPIPQGWEVLTIGDLVEDMRRNVAKGSTGEVVRYVGLEHIPRRSLALDAWEEVQDLGSNKLAFCAGEVLFGKIRPYFHKVSVAPFDGVCSADTIVIRARRDVDRGLMMASVSSDEFVAHATATSNGSKMPRANWGVLSSWQVAYAPEPLRARFNDCINAFVTQQQRLVVKSRNLRRTRDLLLPRLMSGQIDLRGAETEAATQ